MRVRVPPFLPRLTEKLDDLTKGKHMKEIITTVFRGEQNSIQNNSLKPIFSFKSETGSSIQDFLRGLNTHYEHLGVDLHFVALNEEEVKTANLAISSISKVQPFQICDSPFKGSVNLDEFKELMFDYLNSQ